MVKRCPNCGSTNVDTTTVNKLKKGASYIADFAVGAVAGYFLGKDGANEVLSETGAVSDKVNIKNEYECKSCGYVWKEDEAQASLMSNNTNGAEWDYFINVMDALQELDQEETNKEFFNICRQLHHERGEYAGYYRFLESLLYFDRAFYDLQLNGNNEAYKDLSKAEELIDQAIANNDDADFEIVRIVILIWKIYFENPIDGYEELKRIHLFNSREELYNAFATSNSSEGVLEYLWSKAFEGADFADDFRNCEDFTSTWFDLQFVNVILYCARACEHGGDNLKPDLRMALNYCKIIAYSSIPYDEGNSTLTVQEKIQELSQRVNNEPNITNSKNEDEYCEAISELLAEGDITERDRRMLERMRNSLGISEKRAQELEASLSSQISDNEKEYLESVKEYLSEGQISERDRRMLDRLRKSLNISEERANQLEAMA